jgi:chromosome segregation ATPase
MANSASIETLGKNNEALTRELEESKLTAAAQVAAYVSLQEKYDGLSMHTEELTKELGSLRTSYDETRSELNSANRSLEEAQKELGNSDSKLRNLQKIHDGITSPVASLKHDLKEGPTFETKCKDSRKT